jgi:quinol monooxygenase YgiN
MTKLPSLAGLEGLINLDRQGVDIRPTLLRVITDQYMQTPIHTPDEERQFTELALRLLDETDISTRAAVSTRLARHACAPRPIVLQLARDVLEVAEPMLRQSSCLTPDDLSAIAAERGPSYAELIAMRPKPAIPAPSIVPAVAPLVSALNAPAAVTATEVNAAAPEIAATIEVAAPIVVVAPTEVVTTEVVAPPITPVLTPHAAPVIAQAPSAPDDDAPPESMATVEAWELCELFFAASAEERRLILTTLDYVPNRPTNPPQALLRTEVWRLESAALQHNTDAVVRDLERSLGVSNRLAHRIVADELGEPVVVAAKALALPADVLQRMLLFMNPRVGQSVDRVYELAALYQEITVGAAQSLIDIWQDADPAQPHTTQAHTATHVTQWQNTVERARQALSEITRRAPVRAEHKEPISIVAPRRVIGTDAI